MDNEEWKNIPGWEGYYQASTFGRVRSIDRIVPHKRYGTIVRKGKILSPAPDGGYGYLVVNLWREGKKTKRLVHQIIAETWIGPRPVGYEVCHGPNGLTDNSISNIRYGTKSDNQFDALEFGNKFSRRVRCSDGREFNSCREAERVTGIRHVWEVCAGYRKSAGGLDWSFCT